jgi:hypothetical protein
MGEARRASVRGLSTARQELNLIPRKAPSRLTNRLVRTRMLGGVRGRGLAAPLLLDIDWGKGWERRFFLGLSQSVKGFFYSRLYNFLHM